MSHYGEVAALLKKAQQLGLDESEAWRCLHRPGRVGDPRKAQAQQHLQALYERALETVRIVRWMDSKRTDLPLGVPCLATDLAFSEYDVILQRPVRHQHELLEELEELKAEIESIIQARERLLSKVEKLRHDLESLTRQGQRLDHLEFSLSRVEAQTLFGHDPNFEKLGLLEEALLEASLASAKQAQETEKLTTLAEDSLNRRKGRLTVAQHEKLQKLLSGSADPAQRRELWNTIRELDTKANKPLKTKKPKAPPGRRVVDPNVLGHAWESLSQIAQVGGASDERAKALADLMNAVDKKGRAAEKSLAALNRSLRRERAVQDE